MSTALMTGRIATASSPFKVAGFRALQFRTAGFRTKIAGALCLLSLLAAAFVEIFVRGKSMPQEASSRCWA